MARGQARKRNSSNKIGAIPLNFDIGETFKYLR